MNYERSYHQSDGSMSRPDEEDYTEERTETTTENSDGLTVSIANGTPPETEAVIPETNDEAPDEDLPDDEEMEDDDVDEDEDDDSSETVSEVATEDEAEVEETYDEVEDEAEEVDDDEEESDDDSAETVSEVATEAEAEDEEYEGSEVVSEVTTEEETDVEEIGDEIEDETEEVDEDDSDDEEEDDEEESEVSESTLPAIFGEMTLSTSQAAEWLRTVADALEEGELSAEPEDVSVPRKVTYKLELEQEHEGDIASLKFEIDVTVAWRYLANEGEE